MTCILRLSSNQLFFVILLCYIVCTLSITSNETTSSANSFSFWDTKEKIQEKIFAMRTGNHNPYREFNQFINHLFYKFTSSQFISISLISKFGDEVGYYLTSYVRDLFVGTLVYWLTAGVWHFVIYHWLGEELFTKKGRQFPTGETIRDQMLLAQASIFMYAALPILSEFFIESGLTKTYFYVDEIGGMGVYSLYFLVYLALVEFGIYWMHRTLHTNKFLYKHIHALHHKYNKHTTLTPWASIAFNPIDGILQASPYVFFLFFVPVHYFTHMFLLFFSGVWATNIHDTIWGDTEPVMGAKYHTVHHTHYHCNFGQFFIFCDYLFGTLKVPEKEKYHKVE